MRRKPRVNTIIHKSLFIFSVTGIVLILIISQIYPHVFYLFMKPHLTNHVSSLVKANTIAQSLVWRSNKNLYDLKYDKDFHAVVEEYYAQENREELREQILERLEVYYLGSVPARTNVGQGAISSKSDYMLYTSKGDAFYNGESARAAQLALRSEPFQKLGASSSKSDYWPVLHDGEGADELSVLPFVLVFKAGDITCYAINLVEFRSIQNLFSDLGGIGLDDYQIMSHDKVLYQNLGAQSKIDLIAYPDEMFEGLQHEVRVRDSADGMDFLALCSYETENFRIVLHAPRAVLLAPYEQNFRMFGYFLYGLVLLLTILNLVSLRGFLGRLSRLSRQMTRVQGGNYDVEVRDSSTDEIGLLAQTFNMMLSTIRADIAQKVEREKKEQQMQYSLLVSALDPHFVYNTLNTVTFLAKMDRCEDIVVVNNALIGMLKDRLTMKNCKTFDSIAVEKEVLDQYLRIERFLCHNSIEYTFTCPEEDLPLPIPKNILQPLVENAIQHGILKHKDARTRKLIEGKIEVSAARSGDTVRIEIRDNGTGMDAQTLRAHFVDPPAPLCEKDAEHVGIHNVRMRLAFLYGERYTLEAKSIPGEGTSILLVLPVNRGEKTEP